MDVFMEATRRKLRFNTEKGILSIEQMWDLDLTMLDNLAISLQKQYEASKGKSFLNKRSTKDRTIKLQFDVTLAILEQKVAMEERAAKAAKTRRFNEKIASIIEEKKDDDLRNLSVKELEKLIK